MTVPGQGPLYVGTAGWSVPARYADALPDNGTHLQRYARRLNAVEINSSFYRPHKVATYARWAASVPDTFRFAVKVPKAMTHERRLLDCAEPLDRFMAEVSGLGDKLGILLVQLPPSLPFEAPIAAAFFTALMQRIPVPIACEPRHPGWFGPQAASLFRSHGIARVAADPAPVEGAGKPGGATNLVYWRLHGSPRIYHSNYDDMALATLRSRLAPFQNTGIPVWCVFDNTALFHALGNALAIAGS